MGRVKVIHAKSFHPLSIGIRLWTWSPWSHVGVLTEDDEFVIESRAGIGVVVTPVDEFKARYSEWHIGWLPVKDKRKAYEYWLGAVGKIDYDELTIIAQILRMRFHETDGVSCSELVAKGTGLFREGLNRRVTPLHTWLLTRD